VQKNGAQAHEAEVQKAGLRLKTKLYPGVSKDLLAQRRENLAQVQSHVEEIIKVPNDALAARVHNAFARPHLSVPAPPSSPEFCACTRAYVRECCRLSWALPQPLIITPLRAGCDMPAVGTRAPCACPVRRGRCRHGPCHGKQRPRCHCLHQKVVRAPRTGGRTLTTQKAPPAQKSVTTQSSVA
jgi:hypothetical protein